MKNRTSVRLIIITWSVFIAVSNTSSSASSFVKTWGGSRADFGFSIVQTSDGGLVLTGMTNSFGDLSPPNPP